MFSSLLRPKQQRQQSSRRVHLFEDPEQVRDSPSPGPAHRHAYTGARHATADFTEADEDDEEEDDDSNRDGIGRYQQEGGNLDDDEDEDGGQSRRLPILPLFSAAYLDALPVYSLTHAIRIIVQTRSETTLTWDQLRSPQVSQFLVKPMQQQIRNQHFSRATLYCLMANCLQFAKEGQLYPGNAGTSSTRAKVCELLALKLLKEYNTRELIDALSYDFYPLQGMPGAQTPPGVKRMESRLAPKPSGSRTSTLEVAIRASAKHFLAHPVVVQQLEAIWSGAISFYSAADRLHRDTPKTRVLGDGGGGPGPRSPTKPDVRTPLLGAQTPTPRGAGGRGALGGEQQAAVTEAAARRTVSLYDPRQASLFKLSRLRVPRYRSFLSTLSLGVLIGLFLAVLGRRAAHITSLELVFWFWSAGFMLDEVVGFNEQGFSLYIMSFWNIFDLGILVLLIIYYCMRAYGVFLVDPHHWNEMAYDVLAANAILLLPRIFSVLDHYQYFSQLLIAFRLMAVDLAAVTILVLISCSGFFVFFTMSKNDNDAAEVAYKIFQILMGFTPAAWEVWPSYNWLARTLMVLFLIICHFVVVTILITVLTNSFMAIASNATEEHQFLFAINTISMVKNDALFSYIAPGNIFAWLLMPLRYCIPLKQFVGLNRFVIKITHFPLLFAIFFYERYWLAPSMFEPTDLVENPGRGRGRAISFADPASRAALFSPNVRVREESVAGYQKDRALEEVFRRVPDISTLRSQRRNERRKTQNAIRNWMDHADEMGASPANWPTLDSRSGPLQNWHRRYSMSRGIQPHKLRQVSDVRSAASDPADLMSNNGLAPFNRFDLHRQQRRSGHAELKDATDADGDDELVTNDEEDDDDEEVPTNQSEMSQLQSLKEDYFSTPMATRLAQPTAVIAPSSLGSSGHKSGAAGASPRSAGAGGKNSTRKRYHSRTMSTNTILYNPQQRRPKSQASSTDHDKSQSRSQPLSGRNTEVDSPTPLARSPRRSLYTTNTTTTTAAAAGPTRPRPILARENTAPGGRSSGVGLVLDTRPRLPQPRRLSSIDMSVMSDNTNLLLAAADEANAGVPSSFQTQMAMAMMKEGRGGRGLLSGQDTAADRDRMGRLVLARMKTLEESFAEVVREMRELKGTASAAATAPPTRRNSLGEASSTVSAGREKLQRGKSARGATTVQMGGAGGGVAKKVLVRRPTSRRSVKDLKAEHPSKDAKGKGKEISPEVDDAYEDYNDEEGLNAEDGFTRKGSSL